MYYVNFFTECELCTDKKIRIKKCKQCKKILCRSCYNKVSECPFCRNEKFGNYPKQKKKDYYEKENLEASLEEAKRLHKEINNETVKETNKQFTYQEQIKLTQVYH